MTSPDPVDRRLRWADAALDVDESATLLRAALGASAPGGLQVVEATRVTHRIGRRLTVRYRVRDEGAPDGTRVLYAKLFRGRKGQRLHDLWGVLRANLPGGVRVPEPLGYSATHRLLVMDALTGDALAERLPAPGALLARIGAAIATFHRLCDVIPEGTLDVGAHGPTRERDVLLDAVDRLVDTDVPKDLRDRHRDAVIRCCEELIGTHPTRIGSRLLHRDLHPAQVLIDDDAIGLVDLDDVSIGEPELDVGNLVAHLHLLALQRDLPPVDDDATRDLLRGYGDALRADRLEIHVRSALLRLASLARLGRPDVSVLDHPALAARLLDLASVTV